MLAQHTVVLRTHTRKKHILRKNTHTHKKHTHRWAISAVYEHTNKTITILTKHTSLRRGAQAASNDDGTKRRERQMTLSPRVQQKNFYRRACLPDAVSVAGTVEASESSHMHRAVVPMTAPHCGVGRRGS